MLSLLSCAWRVCFSEQHASAPSTPLHRTGQTYEKGARLCTRVSADKVPSAEAADDAAAAAPPPAAAHAAKGPPAPPAAVILRFGLKDVADEWRKAKRLLEEKLEREREERKAKKRRVDELQAAVSALIKARAALGALRPPPSAR